MKKPSLVRKLINKAKPPLKVYWMIENIRGKQNFGDEITPLIINKIWGYRYEWAPVDKCSVAGVGSIIDVLQRDSKGNNIKVWGSGYIKDGPACTVDNLDFYAVRGASTLSRIKPQREVALGDPGLLANLVFDRAEQTTHKVGIVAHYVDHDSPFLDKIRDNKKYKIINPLQSPQKVASDISSCEIVFSSSLHGLIFADCFGVPNYWMPLSDRVIGGDYKFNDYYSATGRKLIEKSPDILGNKEAIDDAICSYEKIESLEEIQERLIQSFPY